jgi:hypothetical protein
MALARAPPCSLLADGGWQHQPDGALYNVDLTPREARKRLAAQ